MIKLPLVMLTSHYILDKPRVSLRLGKSLDPDNLRTGNDVYFECDVKANPIPHKLVWLHKVTWESWNMCQKGSILSLKFHETGLNWLIVAPTTVIFIIKNLLWSFFSCLDYPTLSENLLKCQKKFFFIFIVFPHS